MNHTLVINLFGTSGAGKSTLAAGVHFHLKNNGKLVEFATEYVKVKAYAKQPLKYYDQLFITAQQSYVECNLYNRADYIVSESPLLLTTFYDYEETGTSFLTEKVKHLLKIAETNQVTHINFLCAPLTKDCWQPRGRFQTYEESLQLHDKLITYMDQWVPGYILLDEDKNERLPKILSKIAC